MNKIMLCMAVLLAGVSGCSQSDSELPPPQKKTKNEATKVSVNQQVSKINKIDSSLCIFPESPPSAKASTSDFAVYAWQQFVALNWPAQTGQRGVANCSMNLGSPGQTVWESFKTTDEIFLPGAVDPGPWRDGTGQSVLRYAAKANAGLPVEESIAQAVGGWLIDQNNNPTYYSIAVNKTSYNYVRSHQFYNEQVVSQAENVNFPNDALEIKAAWKIIQSDDDTSRFLTMSAQVEVFDDTGKPTGTTRAATVGLVGFHIIYKPAGFPQWVWATFEQVDNVNTSTGHASYYSANCSGEYCDPNISPKKSGQPFTKPNQITRVTPLQDAVKTVNAEWQSNVAGTPFEYYQLISPQWPVDPLNPGNPQGTPTPGVVANVTMESYIQPTSSCMDCHSTARVPGDKVKSNYSFIFLFAQSPVSGGAK